ncbi:GNAT family N-acetyltransferase [Oceanobacillus massiliensis]|uniref:GNAT family N-acetyltransferase n=1 Tax=Oceanobacillus massiliensis TaxID=1465765 RepID=UPI003017518E
MNIIQQGKQEDSEFIRKSLIAYNMQQVPDHIKTPNEDINFVLKNNNGEIVGGITGNMYWHHLKVNFLWIDENVRKEGYGSKLLKKIEEFAIHNGCRLIWLDTFSFQAPEFYKKNGYEVFGMLENHPEGFNQYFLQKRFE